MSLPRFIVLKSNANNKFLCYGKEKGTTHAFLRFSQELKHQQKCAEFPKSESKNGDEPLATEEVEFNLLKFEVEEAKTAKGFVHIRTCYNNKYWVRKCVDSGTNKIVAEAHEPEEDESKPSCTLFKPIFLGEADDDDDESSLFPSSRGLGNKPQKIQLIHVSELGQQIVDVNNDELVAAAAADDAAAATQLRTFTAYNVEINAMLPERLTLMGHDGKYLTAHGTHALGFMTTDPGTRGVAMYVSPQTRPQYMPIHVRDDNKSWLLNSQSFIAAVATPAPTLFGPIKVDNYVALHCPANGNFVERSVQWVDSTVCINPTITEAAKLQVGEPVVSREIVRADYDLDDAKVYNTSSVEKFSDSRSNRTSVEQTGVFQVEYKTSQTTSWNQSLTVSIGIAFSWTVGFPYVGEFGLEMSYDQTKSSEWGEQVTDEKTVTYTQNVVIPPGKKVTLKVLAMRSMCDVPFTCVVRDVLTDGRTIEYTKTDGLFSGSNEYQFTTHIDEEDA